MDTVREPLLVLDGELRIRSANRAFFTGFHVHAAETVGALIYDLGNGQWDNARLRTLLEEILVQHTVMTDFLVEHEFPVIGHRAMLLNVRKLRLENRELILLAMEDITDWQRDRMKELAMRNEELSLFAQAAGHDLRTPLGAIVGLAQILQTRYGGKLDPDFDKFLGKILDNTNNMAALISDLLHYAMAGEDTMPSDTATDAEQVMNTVLDNLKPVMDKHQAVVTHDPLPLVSIASTSLMQLLQNLVFNAIKYRRPDAAPCIHISARLEREGVCRLSVSDNGIGIKPEHQKEIFAPFKRLHDTDRPGSGLGLAITSKIVKRYGGQIWVQSSPGQGSTFYFTVPV